MDLTKFPRRCYTGFATPIVKAEQLTGYLNGPDIYIKRDDLLGLAAGGNKTRKLEFVVADALRQNADTLITCGAIQSNHCRLTLSAAVREGLDCRLVLEELVPGSYNPDANGNNFLYHLLGVKEIKVCPHGADIAAEMQQMADRITQRGHRPYIIPVGASEPVGILGYIACAQEIVEQARRMNIDFHHVICVSGSGGTQAGLIAGFHDSGSAISVTGINVSQSREAQERLVYDLVRATCAYAGLAVQVPRNKVVCLAEYVGPGYAVLTPAVIEAIRIMAGKEGILLDPVYTGKAMVGLMDLVHKGFFKKGENVLFLHTGGAPALYAYTQDLI